VTDDDDDDDEDDGDVDDDDDDDIPLPLRYNSTDVCHLFIILRKSFVCGRPYYDISFVFSNNNLRDYDI
jgi:hypothetical protein